MLPSLQSLLDTLKDGETLTLPPGEFAGGLVLRASGCTLRSDGETVIVGGEDGLRADGLDGLTLEGVHFRGQEKRAVFVTRSRKFRIYRLFIQDQGGIGILTGKTSDALIDGCHVEGGEDGHAIYLSEGGDDLHILRCIIPSAGRCGIQVNAVQENPKPGKKDRDGISERVSLSGNVIRSCGKMGGAAINLMGVRGGSVSENHLFHNLAGGIALWDDDAGEQSACRNVTVQANEIFFDPGIGRYCIQVGKGCRNIRIPKGSNRFKIDNGPEIEAFAPYRS